jgi:hypothetical protein
VGLPQKRDFRPTAKIPHHSTVRSGSLAVQSDCRMKEREEKDTAFATGKYIRVDENSHRPSSE